MTAKTAYAFAVAEGAIDPRRGKPLVVNSILGREDQVGRGIGTVREPRQIGQGVLQDLTLQIDPRTQSLIARVNFLADVGAPTYGVKLGVATEKYCNTTFVQQPSNSRDIEWMTAAVPGDVLNALASAT